MKLQEERRAKKEKRERELKTGVVEEEKKRVPVHKQDLFKDMPARAKACSQPPCSAKVNISHLGREHKNIATYD